MILFKGKKKKKRNTKEETQFPSWVSGERSGLSSDGLGFQEILLFVRRVIMESDDKS